MVAARVQSVIGLERQWTGGVVASSCRLAAAPRHVTRTPWGPRPTPGDSRGLPRSCRSRHLWRLTAALRDRTAHRWSTVQPGTGPGLARRAQREDAEPAPIVMSYGTAISYSSKVLSGI